jgi:hypothetical protein
MNAASLIPFSWSTDETVWPLSADDAADAFDEVVAAAGFVAAALVDDDAAAG